MSWQIPLTSVEAAKLVGGSAALRNLVRTSRLAYINLSGGKTLKSLRFKRADIDAALGVRSRDVV